MITLYEFVHQIEGAGKDVTVDRLQGILSRHADKVSPLVRNLGTSKNPCLFVEAACVSDLTGLVKSASTGRKPNIGRAFIDYGKRYLPPGKLAQVFPEAPDIIDFAEGRNIKIRSRGETYHFGDFVNAVQIKRGIIKAAA